MLCCDAAGCWLKECGSEVDGGLEMKTVVGCGQKCCGEEFCKGCQWLRQVEE
jgi:hypothetical protein